ncbi:class I SAM-dependent methyltransferase [Ornithinibacillus halotolerans]|uniref:Methyltransferase type 11 domain-containing protein n=1 Tax=Ornithinibacillus halotolerans TaxID=1274357 RepID=A0A916S853_9BACI|nr:class I SAM-dependent methyltransferase [Ornithinibacillus halotolerans]GGA89374.1 hypothetical protein GCM10008025_35010 [Ornithinibacillus halotolerans]
MKQNLENNIIEAYNKKAKERDSIIVQDWKVKERDTFLTYLKSINAQNILEIGAGPGKDSLYFKEQGLSPVSTDISPEMVELCKKKGLDAKVMDFKHLTFPDHHFDAVWAMNCLLHVPKNEIGLVLTEIKRVLKPTGLFYMGVYGGEDFEGIWEDDFYTPKRFFSFYEDEAIKDLVSKYFTIKSFNIVPKEIVKGNYHFQSIILQND